MNVGDLVLVRTYSAGVYVGELEKRDGAEVTLTNARRLWRWYGAAEVGELASRGTSKPKQCKFPAAVPRVLLLGAIEIHPVSAVAQASFDKVPVWSE